MALFRGGMTVSQRRFVLSVLVLAVAGLPLFSQEADLTWYENPYWTPHVIIRGMTRMINVAAADTNKDGIPELALAHGFNANPAQGGSGNISILTSTGDPKALWTITGRATGSGILRAGWNSDTVPLGMNVKVGFAAPFLLLHETEFPILPLGIHSIET